MKKIPFIPLFLALALGSSAQESNKSLFAEEFDSVYAFESTDGFTPIADGKAYVRMFNNSEKLAVQVVAVDRTTQAMFVSNGLSLYIDIDGGHSHRYALNFPKANMNQLTPVMQSVSQDTENADEILGRTIQRITMSLAQRQASFQTPREVTEIDRNSAGLYFDASEALVYTAELPLDKLGGDVGRRKTVNIGVMSRFEMPGMGGGGMMMSGSEGPVTIRMGPGFDPSMMANMDMEAIVAMIESGGGIGMMMAGGGSAGPLNFREIMSGMMIWIPFEIR